VKVQHDEVHLPFRNQPVERFGLRPGSRETVEKEPTRAIGLSDTLGDETKKEIVGHETAVFHERPRFLADRSLSRDGVAEHFPSRDPGDTGPLRDERCLSPLSRAGRPEKQDAARARGRGISDGHESSGRDR
jgi:hypothetical protein